MKFLQKLLDYYCKTSSGFNCLESKVIGGRKSDSLIVIKSGLFEKLENEDIHLADKECLLIHSHLDKTGNIIKVAILSEL